MDYLPAAAGAVLIAFILLMLRELFRVIEWEHRHMLGRLSRTRRAHAHR